MRLDYLIENIGEVIETVRKERGMRVADVARALDVKHSVIAAVIERGGCNTTTLLKVICWIWPGGTIPDVQLPENGGDDERLCSETGTVGTGNQGQEGGA